MKAFNFLTDISGLQAFSFNASKSFVFVKITFLHSYIEGLC